MVTDRLPTLGEGGGEEVHAHLRGQTFCTLGIYGVFSYINENDHSHELRKC